MNIYKFKFVVFADYIYMLCNLLDNFLIRIKIKRIRANILFNRPDNRTIRHLYLFKVVKIPEFLEYAKIEQIRAIIYTLLPISEDKPQFVIFRYCNLANSWIHRIYP